MARMKSLCRRSIDLARFVRLPIQTRLQSFVPTKPDTILSNRTRTGVDMFREVAYHISHVVQSSL